MKCIANKKAQYLCIDRLCSSTNPYICGDNFDPFDKCKQNHESCSLISLSLLIKYSQTEGSQNPENNNSNPLLFEMLNKSKQLTEVLSSVLNSSTKIKQIISMLESGRTLSAEDKRKVSNFVSTHKSDNNAPSQLNLKIEQLVQDLQFIFNNFNRKMKQTRNQEINDLKKRIITEDKPKNNHFMPILPQRPSSRDKLRRSFENSSQEKHSRSQYNKFSTLNKQPEDESNHNKLLNMKIHGLSDLLKTENQEMKARQIKPIFIGPNPQKIREGAKSGIRLNSLGIEQKKSNLLKDHIPKGPLFSKITNDIKSINSFFSGKISETQLLYRASEHDFLASKFHELCDGHSNTLTILINQYDRVVGGFTPLVWQKGGGQWYEDQEGKTFIFSLSTGQRYPLVTKHKAIWCSKNYGPSFGFPDLQISDKANKNCNSCVNFPMCYNNGNYKNTPESKQQVCGIKNGHFMIKEWQVYKLSFK